MRKFASPTEQETREGPQSVSFQIAHGNGRFACSLQTEFPTQVQAKKYLLTNWAQIERMARDYLESGTHNGGQVKLVMP
jgi:hypothetical protein